MMTLEMRYVAGLATVVSYFHTIIDLGLTHSSSHRSSVARGFITTNVHLHIIVAGGVAVCGHRP